jgi:hypothetical protein
VDRRAGERALELAAPRDVPSETRLLVTEVPMLAPMMIGIAPSTVSAPAATSATVSEVVVDELWTSVVPRMPANRPDERVGRLLDEHRREALAEEAERQPQQVEADEERQQDDNEQNRPPRLRRSHAALGYFGRRVWAKSSRWRPGGYNPHSPPPLNVRIQKR